jgi:hypothetical protein
MPCDTLYSVNSSEVTEEFAQAVKTIHAVDIDIMHRHFAHPLDEVLNHARKHTVGFPDVVFEPIGICGGCAQSKLANRSYPASDKCATHLFKVIHSDLKSYLIKSHGKKLYMMTFIDNFSGYTWITFLLHKNERLLAMKQFIAMLKTQFNAVIKQWHCNEEGEYVGHEFIHQLKDNSIIVKLTPLYTTQTNGHAERFNRTISDKLDAMQHHAGVPDSWWEYSIRQG